MYKIIKPKTNTIFIPESEHECLIIKCVRCALRDYYCWESTGKPNKARVEKNIMKIVKDNKPNVEKEIRWIREEL